MFLNSVYILIESPLIHAAKDNTNGRVQSERGPRKEQQHRHGTRDEGIQPPAKGDRAREFDRAAADECGETEAQQVNAQSVYAYNPYTNAFVYS
eukprot:CAMPEP_0179844248 /NCGR_PEP_ID=MMETSP0982-20121206/4229_1 /TAXON_ID=483367 /ORGANISM="non described non described, Strain CCMP 2436" /LENGTH=93 /DNA_ID=CAMNT_0021728915 /DNA_START=644 /DNA_END=928 /DNA_ORIENTATION=+